MACLLTYPQVRLPACPHAHSHVCTNIHRHTNTHNKCNYKSDKLLNKSKPFKLYLYIDMHLQILSITLYNSTSFFSGLLSYYSQFLFLLFLFFGCHSFLDTCSHINSFSSFTIRNIQCFCKFGKVVVDCVIL